MTGRAGRSLLTWAVRGGGERGTDWGEAMLRELDEVDGRWARLRWALSCAAPARRDRRAAMRAARTGARPVQTADALSAAVWPGRSTVQKAVRVGVAAVIGAAGLAAVNRFVLTVQYMPSASMAPTIAVGDRFLVDRLGFRITGLHYGDVVVFAAPGSDVDLVKRIVGLPHDVMSCVDGQLARNGQRVHEGYLPGGTVTDCAPATVGEGQVFVLGDDRVISYDSRQLGPVPITTIVGRAVG